MKKALLCFFLLAGFGLGKVFAQPNIFNQNDPMVEYSEANPPATPPPNTLAKWVRKKIMTWNTDKFKSYYYDGMAFRLRFPKNYDPTKKYPVILFFHGGGEIDAAVNNEFHLIHGAQQFEQLIETDQFNAFMLFPQVSPPGTNWDNSYFDRINHVLDSLQKYCNSDPDRVISIGLSMGGLAAVRYAASFPQRAAVGIGASPALIQTLSQDNKNNLQQIRLWVANGGIDVNPDTTVVKNFVTEMRLKGADVRQNLYPDWGHNVWYNQWAEPYLLPYWNAAHKANPVLYFQKYTYATEAGLNAKMGISPGYAQYQWQKNNIDVPAATTNELIATTFGSYRVRFKRTAASEWSEWSPNPVVLSLDNTAPSAPSGLVSTFTGSNFVKLRWNLSSDNAGVTGYDVYVNGVKKATTTNDNITLENLAPNTSIKFVVKAFDEVGNTSPASNELTVTTLDYQNGLKYRYYEATYTTLPDFTAISPVVRSGVMPNVDISNSRADNYAYIWEGFINITHPGQYTFETVSDDGSRLYFNTAYSPGATPLVNNDGLHAEASATGTVTVPAVGLYPIAITFFEYNGGEKMKLYWSGPGFGRQEIPAYVFSTGAPTGGADVTPPSVPVNLKVVNTLTTSVSLDWDDATDNVGVTSYDVFVNGVKTYSVPGSSITADNLTPATAYTFTVRAVDQANNVSALSSGVSATTQGTTAAGLKYRYYEGSFNQLPNFNMLTPVKTGTTPNIDLTVKNRADTFAMVWEGNINITTPGVYTFETLSDDGSRFYFNTLYNPTATPLVNNDYFHGPTSVSASYDIKTAGSYPVTITFFEYTGGEVMQLYYSGPGIERQLVPNSAFTLPAPDNTPPSVPTGLKMVNAFATSVVLDWDDATDNLGVTSYDIYVNGTKRASSFTSNVEVGGLVAGTTYAVKVKALDQAGNQSGFSAEISAATTSASNGLKYSYYEGEFYAVPNFVTTPLVKTGTTPNVDLSVRKKDDYFAMLWEGNITITTPGRYTFETISDDGSKFYFNTAYYPNATPLVNNDNPHGPTSVSASVDIDHAGVYPIAISFFENTGGQLMEVYYSGPGITRQLIPNNVLTLPSADVTPPVAPGNLRAVYTGRNFAYLDWDASTDNVGVVGYNVYVNSTKKYSTTETTITDSLLAAGTSYSFAIKAVDVAGNESAASTVTAATEAKANGLKYRFYTGTWDALPNFNNLNAAKTGSSANLDLSVRTAGVNDNFAFVWEGYINIQIPGTYTFELNSDDGSKMYFNSLYSPTAVPFISNDYLHGPTAISKSIVISKAGLYPVAMTFFENTGNELMQIYMSGPGIPKQLIPNVAFIESSTQGNSVNGVTTTSIGNANTTGLETNLGATPTITRAYPNPIKDWLNIDFFNQSSNSDIKINVYDLNGKVVSYQYFGNLPAGNNTLKMNVAGTKLAPGVYMVKLDVNGMPSKVFKLVKTNK